jgi:ribosomal protein S12 methylthiotransferase accessory factor
MSIDLRRLESLCGSPWGVMQNPHSRIRNSEGLPVTVVVTRNRENKNLGAKHSFEGVGASFNPEVAYVKSILEAAERYCQTFGPDPESLKKGSYLDLKEDFDLIAPERLNLYTDAAYSTVEVRPYEKDRSILWSTVISVHTGQQYWIPSDFVYYNTDKENRLFVQTSNGTAIHESLAKAIESASLELIERDLLMIYWKQKLRPISIDSKSVFSFLGIENKVNCLDFFENIRFFWYPLPFSLYAVSCGIFGNTEKDQPAFVLGGAAHQNLFHSLLKSLEEALQVYSLSHMFVKSRKKLKPEDVVHFSDHAFFYADSENQKKHNSIFLKDSEEQLTVSDILKTAETSQPSESPILDYLRSLGLDLLYCDLTTRDVHQAGYKVVRAISPGLLGLDMNHNLRLDYIPTEKKYWVLEDGSFELRDFTSGPLNESPHPFA